MKEHPIPAAWLKLLPFGYAAVTALTFAALLPGLQVTPTVAALTFPFAQLALLLRAVSRTGLAGRGLAGMLWLLPSALLAARALRLMKDRPRRAEVAALWLLALVIPAALYLMTNPLALTAHIPMADGRALPLLSALPVAAIWSCVILYLVVRLTRSIGTSGAPRLMAFLFYLVALLGAAIAAGIGVRLLGAVKSFTGGQDRQATDIIMAALRAAASVLSDGLLLMVVLRALQALAAMFSRSEAAASAVDNLAAAGLMALKVMAMATVAVNLSQLLLLRWLSDVSLAAEIPLTGLVLSLAALLFARIYTESRRLEAENELFV